MADAQLCGAIEDGSLQGATKILTASMCHAAWSNYFAAIQLRQCLTGDAYQKAVMNYTYDIPQERQMIKGIRELKDFTVANIEAFNAQYLTVNEEALSKAVTVLPYHAGNKEYKPRQTIKAVVTLVSDKGRIDREIINLIAEVLLALEHYQGQEFKPTRMGEIRELITGHHPLDTEIQIIKGVSLVLKSSSSLEIRLDKAHTELLNSKLAATA